MEKSSGFKKIEAQSKSLTRKAVGLEKFKANIDELKAQMSSVRKSMTARIEAEKRESLQAPLVD